LIYLPGLHGDWTLVWDFRAALAGKVRFVEITYPSTVTWTLEEYARGIENALLAAGVREGWLLGESFGSQPAWAMIARTQRGEAQLKLGGLILAGGFVKHPWPWGARLLRSALRVLPRFVLLWTLRLYAVYARFRHRRAADRRTNVARFVANRQRPGDFEAMGWRCNLVAESDPRPTATSWTLPVFHLAGLIDPIVPGPWVCRWLRRNCPGFRKSKTIFIADHNVLGTAPEKAARAVLEWMRAT
jgi:pimeloyl-ACP methyl ester carboxylesterase